MDVREKLVELIGRCAIEESITIEPIAESRLVDFLVNHGVTVQEWISVEDELPETGEYVVCIAKRNPFSRFMPMVARIEKNGWVNPMTEQYISEVTHWMPLPNPPKGE